MDTVIELKNKPVGLWPLDTDKDYSGYGRNAIVPAAAGMHLPLVAGLSHATVFNNTNQGQFPAPVFQQGHEGQPFTLEATVMPIERASGLTESDGPQQVIGHSGRMDGIVIDGTLISFIESYTDTEVVISHRLQELHLVRISAVHTREKNSLYVNGQLVGEVDIPEDVRGKQYVASDGFLYSGASGSTKELAVNSVAVYGHALSAWSIEENYRAHLAPEPDGLVGALGGRRFAVSKETTERFLTRVWANDWTTGSLLVQAASESGVLYPETEDGLVVGGEWYNTFELDSASTSSIYGVNVDWIGDGVDIEASLDGESWVPVERGLKVSLIADGFDPTETVMHIRAVFEIGHASAYLERLEVNGYTSNSFFIGETLIEMNGVSPRNGLPPASFSDAAGVWMDGSIVVTDTSNTPDDIETVEVWFKGQTPIMTNMLTTDEFVNGDGTFAAGEWQIHHFVVSGGVGNTFTVSGTGQVGQIAVYGYAFTQADARRTVDSYFSAKTETIVDNSSIIVGTSADGAIVYGHDWTIEGAG